MMLSLVCVSMFHPIQAFPLDSPSEFGVTVEQAYSLDGSVSGVLLTTVLENKGQTYLRMTIAGRTLIEHIDRRNRTEKIWTESLGKIYLGKFRLGPKALKKNEFQRKIDKSDVREISGIPCYSQRMRSLATDLLFVEWIRTNSPHEVVSSLTYVNGRLADSTLEIDFRPGKQSDLSLFAFPKNATEVVATDKSFLAVVSMFSVDEHSAESPRSHDGTVSKR